MRDRSVSVARVMAAQRTLIVGDIHGCHAELLDLVDRAALARDDRLLSVGDFVDRGPETPELLRLFRDETWADAIQGNHERKHVTSFAGTVKPARSQLISRQQIGEQAYPAAVAWFDALPRWAELDDVLVVHGFYEPGLPVSEQREKVIVGTLGGEMYLKKTYDAPWYSLYDGEKPLVVGHHDYRRDGQPFVHRDRVFGVDTSCVHGSRLTGLLVPEFRFVSVASRGDHWRALQAQHGEIAAPPRDSERTLWSQYVAGSLGELEGLRFSVLERLRDVAGAHAELRDEAPREAEALDALFADCERRAAALAATLRTRAADVIAALRADGYDALSHADQGRRFSDQVGPRPERALLHKARLGRLDAGEVMRAQKTPEALGELERALAPS